MSVDKYVIVHGSAIGRFEIGLGGCPDALTKGIGHHYFSSTSSRVEACPSNESFNAEIYVDDQSQSWCIYSYVLNQCRGPRGEMADTGFRPGQYFAISLAVCGYYVKETFSVYNLLKQFYDKGIVGRVIQKNDEVHDYVYAVKTIKQESQYLEKLSEQIIRFFDRDCSSSLRSIPPETPQAKGWRGKSFNPADSDNRIAIASLLENGRFYVSTSTPTLEYLIGSLSEERERIIKEIKDYGIKIDTLLKEIDEKNNTISKQNKTISVLKEKNDEMASHIRKNLCEEQESGSPNDETDSDLFHKYLLRCKKLVIPFFILFIVTLSVVEIMEHEKMLEARIRSYEDSISALKDSINFKDSINSCEALKDSVTRLNRIIDSISRPNESQNNGKKSEVGTGGSQRKTGTGEKKANPVQEKEPKVNSDSVKVSSAADSTDGASSE